MDRGPATGVVTPERRVRECPRVDVDEEIARTASTLLAEANREADGNSGVETTDA